MMYDNVDQRTPEELKFRYQDDKLYASRLANAKNIMRSISNTANISNEGKKRKRECYYIQGTCLINFRIGQSNILKISMQW